MRYTKCRITIAVLLLVLICAAGCSAAPEITEYGVFIGATADDMEYLAGYGTVVIDAEYFTQEDIQKLQQGGARVYSYLNIGSIETFREAYPRFKSDTLMAYEGWPEEFWVDVSQAQWQQFIKESADALFEKGIDGFFLDNADVYYQFNTPEIYEGLVTMIAQLNTYGLDIIINGGDIFVTQAVLEPPHPEVYITGVNQECVFTSIDFENDRLIKQEDETSLYYREYLSRCKDAGLAVYLTEYANKNASALRREIENYSVADGFFYYISGSKELETGD